MTEDPGPPAKTATLFDQSSRYHALATGIRAVAPPGSTVLDVGCGEAMLLGDFLPGYHITYLDPLLTARDGEQLEHGRIIGRMLDQTTVSDQSFDVAVCVDVLEHIPASSRKAFLEHLVRVARRGVVLAAPFDEGGAARQADDTVNLAYRMKTGEDYSWLAEHHSYGLPGLSETKEFFRQNDLHLASFGNGRADWLADLLALHVVLLDEPQHLQALRQLTARFESKLLPFDHLAPSYRHVLVACRDATPDLPTLPESAETATAADKAWTEFRLWVDVDLSRHADRLAGDLTALRLELQQQQRQAQVARQTARRQQAELQGAVQQSRVELQAVRSSMSWRLTAPLRFCGRAATATRRMLLRVARGTGGTIPEAIRWPIKRAFFWVLYPLLKNTQEYREFAEARRVRCRVKMPPRSIPAPQDGHCDIITLGVIDWHLRLQRPQHLALEMAKMGHRSFYFTPRFQLAEQPGYRIEQLFEELPAYQISLNAREHVSIYDGSPDPANREFLASSMRKAFADIGLAANLCLVDHPGWVDLAPLIPRSRLVYDCMDNHHGFAEAGTMLPSDEQRLLEAADGVVVTSNYLHDEMAPRHSAVSMVRNGCDPAHFATVPDVRSDSARPTIGYFGAVAEWFDTELLAEIAAAMPDCDFLIVGAETANAQLRLKGQDNITFVGEVSYTELPAYVAQMDTLLIPFVIDQLTLATNPVKAYEALAAGRPVVATEMPELMDTDLAPYVHTASNADGLVACLRTALAEARDPERVAAMRAFAAKQSWAARAQALYAFTEQLPAPKIGVVIVSWNGLDLTRRCLASVLEDPRAGDVEVVVVDNASTDGTVTWLDEIEGRPRVRIIRNSDNRGFGAACNQGLAAAAERDPDLLVILNNDIVVTPGWTQTMMRHLRRDPSIGLIGPVTNNIGNEARIDTAYVKLDEMWLEQRVRTGAAAGLTFEIPVLAFFCVAIPLDVYREVGGLDENFGTGFFEDDDYCQRVRQLGRKLVCAEDIFVHHELSASFKQVDQDERQRLFETNRVYYEKKWGPWQRHEYRPPPRRQSQTGS